MQSKLVLKVLIGQSIQFDQIFLFKSKGLTSATEQNNILIRPIPHFEIFNIGKLFWILPLDPHWGPNPLVMIIFAAPG